MAEVLDIAAAEYKLKRYFLPGVQNTIDETKPVLYKKIKADSEGINVEGNQVTFSIRTQNAQGVGARASDTSILPPAVRSRGIKPVVPLKNMFGTAEVSSKLIQAARTNTGAFESGVQDEFDGLVVSYVNDMGRQMFGNANGKVAGCGTTTADTEVVLAADAFMQHFDIGMRIDIVIADTGVPITNGDSRNITAIDKANKTITLDGSDVVTTDSTHMVTREDTYGVEISGLAAIIGNGTLYGYAPASYPRWESSVFTSAGEYSLEKTAEFVKEVKVQSGHYPDILVGDHQIMLWHWHLLKKFAQIEFDKPIIKKYDGGYRGIDVTIDGREMELMADPNCPAGTQYGLTSKHLQLKQYAKPDFMKPNGNILISNAPGNAGTPTYKVVLEHYSELIIKQRNSHFVASGLTKPSTYVGI